MASILCPRGAGTAAPRLGLASRLPIPAVATRLARTPRHPRLATRPPLPLSIRPPIRVTLGGAPETAVLQVTRREASLIALAALPLRHTGPRETSRAEAVVAAPVPLDVLTHPPATVGVVHPVPGDAARRLAAIAGGSPILAALPLATPILRPPLRRPEGVAGEAVTAGTPLPVTDGEVRTTSHLPWRHGQGTGVAADVAVRTRVEIPRVRPHADAVVETLVIA